MEDVTRSDKVDCQIKLIVKGGSCKNYPPPNKEDVSDHLIIDMCVVLVGARLHCRQKDKLFGLQILQIA